MAPWLRSSVRLAAFSAMRRFPRAVVLGLFAGHALHVALALAALFAVLVVVSGEYAGFLMTWAMGILALLMLGSWWVFSIPKQLLAPVTNLSEIFPWMLAVDPNHRVLRRAFPGVPDNVREPHLLDDLALAQAAVRALENHGLVLSPRWRAWAVAHVGTLGALAIGWLTFAPDRAGDDLARLERRLAPAPSASPRARL